MSIKVQFVISDEAMNVINAAATERKRGEWLSDVVVQYSRIVTGEPAPDDDGLLERIDSRLARIEKQVGLLIVERSA